MRVAYLARAGTVCIASFLLLSSAAEGTNDCYDSKLVRSWLEHPAWPLEGISWFDKTIYRSGDRIALGIVHAFTTTEMVEPDRVKRIVSLLRLSFSKPELIARERDSDPAVTTLLLSFLEQHQSDQSVRESIAAAGRFIATQLKDKSRR
jgi:hypothetical protein